MADHVITTPGVISRRTLFSVAAAVIPTAAATGTPRLIGSSPSVESRLPAEVVALLARYGEVGALLSRADADFAAAVGEMPEWARPEMGPDGEPGSRLPLWTREELAELGLPATLPLRLSMADLHRFNRDLRDGPAELRVNRKQNHRARVSAWKVKRREQKAWFARTGADAVERRRQRLMATKREVERELMATASSSFRN